ncbi:MAG: Eco57I restriction-modification methylase domain-containing protein [Promethearchaeota archaeon]
MDLQKSISGKQKLIKAFKLHKNIEVKYHSPMNDEIIKKKKGIYYTPREITSYICFQTITSYITQLLNGESLDLYEYLNHCSLQELQKLLLHLNSVKILDPACGTGIFLIEVSEILFQFKKFIFNRLKNPINEYEIKRGILINNIFGVDLFLDVVKKTKNHLLEWLGSNPSRIQNLKSLSILDWNIRQGNSLMGWVFENLGTIKFKNLYQGNLKKKFQHLQKKLSPILNFQIQNAIKLLQSKNINDLIKAFLILKNLQKKKLNSSIPLLTKILEEIHNKIYQFINPIFANSIPFKQFSRNQTTNHVEELVKHQLFHWQIDFGEIMNNGGFNIIIGNPPYIFIRGENFSSFERTFYKAKYLANYESLAKGKARQTSKINTFSLFIIRSIELLKQNHFLGFIIPNTFLRTTTNDFIRQFILKNTYIQEIVDLKGEIFKGVTTSTILLFLQKTNDISKHLTVINFNVDNLLNYQFDYHFITQTRFFNNPVMVFNIHIDTDFEKNFNLMKLNTFKLGEITKEIIEGIVCRKKDDLFTGDPTHPLAKKLLRGKDIGRYQINWKDNQYILYAVDTSITKTKLHRPRPQWVHEAPEKFLTQRIGGGVYPIQVAYDNSQYYTFASINNIIFKEPLIYEKNIYLNKYILGILNSKLINAYYLLNYSNKSSLTVNITKTFLESLPIKKVNASTQKLISILIEYLLFLYQYHKSDIQILEFFDSFLLDSLIYEIYFPTLVKTNLFELLSNYFTILPSTATNQEKFEFLSLIMHEIQNNLSIINIINKLKNNQFIQRIEKIFQKRIILIKKKKQIG